MSDRSTALVSRPDYIAADFDEKKRILHLSFRKAVHPTTPEHLDARFAALQTLLDRYLETGRIYLIINMSNFILEPELKWAYAAHARAISEKYIMPNGIARYGYQITRITVRAGYQHYLGESPNIFNSRDEAYQYIDSLIEKQSHSEQ